MSISDAVAKEVAWLVSFGDGLPALVAPNGPWTVIQGYEPRVAPKKRTGVYITVPTFRTVRFANVRSMTTYDFQLKLVWPLSSGIGSAEDDLQLFYQGVDLLMQRIYGLIGDKTHGGRFLSVGESPRWISAQIDDPDTTIGPQAGFSGEIIYSADDKEFPN